MNRIAKSAAAAALTLAAMAGIRASAAPAAPAAPPPAAADIWVGDTVHSSVGFRIKHLGTSWTHGRFNEFSFSVKSEGMGSLVSSADFVVKSGSVDTGNAKRDQHLKSPDFFNAALFPDISFKSAGAKAVDESCAELTGDLTLHGVTRSLIARVTKVGSGKGMKGEELLGLECTFTIKRSDYGMDKYADAVGDDVRITVAAEVAKQ